jgi:hypothetical protein
MSQESLKRIAEQVLNGRKLHEIDFGEPKLNLDEKLGRIDMALRQFPLAPSDGGRQSGA